MSDSLVFVLPAGSSLAALAVGRWWTLLLPVLAWVLVFLQLEWMGISGDSWPLAMLGQILIGVAAAGAGLMLRMILPRLRQAR